MEKGDRSFLETSIGGLRTRYATKKSTGNTNIGSERLFNLMASYLSTEVEDIEQYIANHVEYTLAHTRYNFDVNSAYQSTAFSLRDRMIEYWNDTQSHFKDQEVKRVYYLSIEYLMGRSLLNAVTNLGLETEYSKALKNLGADLEILYDQEKDAALGNGGLGRLAACFLDSLATLNYPAWGYGIRYSYGMFKQGIRHGWQIERPDYWLLQGNPWELIRHDVSYRVSFGGKVVWTSDEEGNSRPTWESDHSVIAVAYDTPIPGYGTLNTLNLRLWEAKPAAEFDLSAFNAGDYDRSLHSHQQSSTITNVLYPDDSTTAGKSLRLHQQYFFVSATLQDILRRFRKTGKSFSEFHEQAAIQLNDTHPTLSIPELMRLFLDIEQLTWDEAWPIITKTFAYTNHTVLPEALEKWPVDLIGSVLPRHLEIIYEINRRLLERITKIWPGDHERASKMSIIEESHPKMVRMANLAVVGSHSVNGVAKVHSEIIKKDVFNYFYELWPEKFNNKTNGITPRRWLLECNRRLSKILTSRLGNNHWVTNLDDLRKLSQLVDDKSLQEDFADAKLQNKINLAKKIKAETGVTVDPNALFDIQVKRIHEYKRQLLNILGVIHRYKTIINTKAEDRKNIVPRVCIFAGKAAPGYWRAKLIIKLINTVGSSINNDDGISNLLKVVFLPDYNVSLAEVIVPASDISQHISTAGTEASGTSNMKFALNAGLILGTWDGANIEIAEEVNAENMFLFGLKPDEVDKARGWGERPISSALADVLKFIQSGAFGEPYDTFKEILDPLWRGNDYYLVGQDFDSYLNAQKTIDATFRDKATWRKKMILTTAGMGKFSSDRTIKEYAEEIWHVKPCKLSPTDAPINTPSKSESHHEETKPDGVKHNESVDTKKSLHNESTVKTVSDKKHE
eukprot:TRINITY_DN4079_c0_g1_i2.p1 TRINITY_DN4079_c0_g1~~TRINITY_DN4079_c0_g1_i2.p1  ORF type:complete len:905 (-),score=171.72 TRINITY_DN4079_c0_g1_i2:79-2793(-)